MPTRRQALPSIEPLATFLFFSLILIFSLALPSLLVKAEPVTSDAAGSVTPGDMNTDALLLPTDDGGFVEAPRLGTDVIMTVNGTIARVTVTQRFENNSDRWLEGIYVFPLPEQSAVDALRMEIGSRVIEGEIKGRADAKKAYEAAKDAGQKASLVEQERPNIFANSVANIGPHEAIVVRIEYQETVKQDAGVYSLRFPLVVAPRYNPKGSEITPVDYGGKPLSSDPVADRDRISPPVLDPAKAPKINPVSIEVGATQESAPQTVDAAPPVPNPTQAPDTSMVAADTLPDADASSPQATQPSQPDSLAVPRVASTEPLRQAMLFILLLTFLSAATFIAWRYSRRDIASPRRIGRRI